jgi:CRP/FNR family transcriptional regulator, cyclic AMP receptor protein
MLENRCVPSSQAPFLRQLSAADAEALVQRSRRRAIRKSEPIMRAGAAGDFAAVVLKGRVKFVAYGNDGREVVLALRGPGELIGEMAALGHQLRSATAIAVDDVEIGYLSGEQLREFFAEHPDAAIVLVRMLVGRLTEADADRVGLATQDSVARLAKRLLELVAEHGTQVEGGVRIELVLTQGELASWTGATRETVSRALRMMRRLGWIATDRRRIIVIDQDALRERAGARPPGGL